MMNPVKAAFVPSAGRIGRMDYAFAWVASMLLIGAGAVATMIVLAVVVAASSPTMEHADGLMNRATPLVTLLIVMPASIYAGAVLGRGRLHDLDRTGRWMIAYYACYAACIAAEVAALSMPAMRLVSIALGGVSALALLALAVLPGTKGPNRYGPVPPRF